MYVHGQLSLDSSLDIIVSCFRWNHTIDVGVLATNVTMGGYMYASENIQHSHKTKRVHDTWTRWRLQ